MFCRLCAKKSLKVIAMSHPFPKNQMRRLSLLRTLKLLTFYFSIIRIVSFKINILISTRLPNSAAA